MRFKITEDMINLDSGYVSDQYGKTKLNIELSDFFYEDDDHLYKRLWENDLKVTGNVNVKFGSLISLFGTNEFYSFSFSFDDDVAIISKDKITINKQLKNELINPRLVTCKSHKDDIDREFIFKDIKKSLAENIEHIINEINKKVTEIIKIEE